MRKTRDRKRYIMLNVVVVLLAVFLVSFAFLLLEIWDKHQGGFSKVSIQSNNLKHNGEEYVLKENIETFLVMGLDKFEQDVSYDSYNNDLQADFLMLFVFDNDAKKVSALHINRDSMVKINVLGVAGETVGIVEKQIALAHTYGNGKDVSCRNVADSVSELLLGAKVNHYISITMDAVPTLNDLVGGVEVTVLDDFSGIDDTLIKGEKVTLMGEQTLRYVRTRYGLEDSRNSTRMVRQKQYINAFYDKFKACVDADEEFIVNTSLQISDYIVSDRSVTQLQTLAEKINTYDFVDIKDIEGESKMGEKFVEFYPDEASVKNTVINLFYKAKR